tara:strand:+ start:220 stop:486 length:267 start_codon:yes stop_codon:yes gene_type:complete
MKFDIIDKFDQIQQGIDDVNFRLSRIESNTYSKPQSRYMSVKQVQKELGKVTRKTLDNWHKKGILKKNYVGSRVLYFTKDIEKLTENQ